MGAKGLTLFEVVLAVGLLAIVLLAFTGLQVTSLRAASQGRITQSLVQEAHNFLNDLRANPQSLPTRCTSSLTLGQRIATCTYTPCKAQADGTLICQGVASQEATAFRVRLQVPKDRPRLDLETVVYQP